MKLVSRTTIAAVEAQLRDLANQPPNFSLQIPKDIAHAAAGGGAAAVQLLISWAQQQNLPTLRTYLTAGKPQQVEEFVSYLHGIIAVLISSAAYDNKTKTDLMPSLRSAALQRLEVLQGVRPRNAMRGPDFDLLCFDHLNRGAPFLLYRPGALQPRDRHEFMAVTRIVLQAIVPAARLRDLPSDLTEALGGILFETFRNTADHARRDLAGNVLTRSVRGIHARRYEPRAEFLPQITEGYEPLQRYCERMRPDGNSRWLQFIELSIFDSGPGFAQAASGKPISELSIEEERAIVSDCFLRGRTSKRRAGFGEGLPLVIRLLRRHRGFLRLRTGRLSLHADLSTGGNEVSPAFESWVPAGYQAAPPVTGSLLTIILPLDPVE
ncbi:hypothetical protein ACFOMD_00455 [Sphingoaurantiacus capsulatus]|uniref:ATP-binding protein n=1 Tax=Sphingoaurantiacus capsulatus TaxID=1771310 RepID=A0ABV7X5J3_9SPHN